MSERGVAAAPPPPARAAPLRVLHVLTEPQGGGGVHVRDLTRAGVQNGELCRTAVPSLRPGGAEPRLGLVRLVRAARQADVIHCHGVRAALIVPPARAPVIVTTHGLHGVRGQQGAKRTAARALSRMALGRACRVICVSDDDTAEVSSLSRRLGRRCVTIVNGVTPLPLAGLEERDAVRESLGLPSAGPVLLLVGSLIHQKNPELALQAAAIARARLPDLVLLVAGDGHLMPRLRETAAPGDMLLGQRDDVASLIAACDAVINTSRWEGLSLALLEALWRGRPLIVADTPGNTQAAGDAGLSAPPTPGAIADAIIRLFHEPGLLTELTLRARPRAETHFDARRMIDATLTVHLEVAR